MKGFTAIDKIKPSQKTSFSISEFEQKLQNALNDDLNSPVLIAHLFDGLKTVNNLIVGTDTITEQDLIAYKNVYSTFLFDILGLELPTENNQQILGKVVDLLLNLRVEAKNNKNYALSDQIRNELNKLGIVVRDSKDGFEWEISG